MFNSAQIHLALNHAPLFGILVGMAILLAGYLLQQGVLRKTGLVLLVLGGLSVIPVYLSGESAEELVEHKPGVSEAIIHDHEEAAELALILTLVTGAGAAGVLLFSKRVPPELERKAGLAVLALSVVAVIVVARAAHLGGMIRHDELRSGVSSEAGAGSGEAGVAGEADEDGDED